MEVGHLANAVVYRVLNGRKNGAKKPRPCLVAFQVCSKPSAPSSPGITSTPVNAGLGLLILRRNPDLGLPASAQNFLLQFTDKLLKRYLD